MGHETNPILPFTLFDSRVRATGNISQRLRRNISKLLAAPTFCCAGTTCITLTESDVAATGHSDLNSVTFIGNIDGTRQNILVDLLRGIHKGLLNIVRRLGTSLKENETILLSKRPSLLR